MLTPLRLSYVGPKDSENMGASPPLAPTVSTTRKAATQESLGPSSLAQSMTTNPTESLSAAGPEEQTGPTGLPPVFDLAVGNSSGSTLLGETPTWVDATSSSRAADEIRGPRSSLGASEQETSSAGQSTGMAESKGVTTLVDTADSSHSTKPKSEAIAASIFSTAQNMSIFGGSYHLNVYPPEQGSFPKLADRTAAWDRGIDIAIASDNNNVAAIQIPGGNLQEASPPALIVSEERLGKYFGCSRFTANDF